MIALLQTFRDLLVSVEQRLGYNSDPALAPLDSKGNPIITSTAFMRAVLTGLLSNASKQCWEMPEGKGWVWPFTVLTKTLTPDPATGMISLADIDYGVWLSLWFADPRPASSGGRTAVTYPIPWNADSAGIWPVQVPATIFAFYIPRAPEYTLTPVVRATEYDVDDLVYDGVDNVAVDATPATGQCYRCLIADSSGADLYDPAKWQEQAVYKHFQSAMAQYAQSDWLESKGNYDTAAQMNASAREDLERKFLGIYPNSPTGNLPPWISGGCWFGY